MKTLLYILLLIVNVGMAQELPYPCGMTLVTSKDSVLSTEEITATFSLTGVEGHIYIGVENCDFEAVGNDRWEGDINYGETKTLTFTVKLKEGRYKSSVVKFHSLAIGWNIRPWGKAINEDVSFKSILLKLIDYDELKKKQDRRRKAATDSSAQIRDWN